MRALRIPLRALVPAVVSLALLSACSRQSPTAPFMAGDSDGLSRMLDASVYGQQSFFPLAIGNRWHATSDDHLATIPTGGGPPIDEMTIHTDITRDLTGTEEISGLLYTLMRETLVSTAEQRGRELAERAVKALDLVRMLDLAESARVSELSREVTGLSLRVAELERKLTSMSKKLKQQEATA